MLITWPNRAWSCSCWISGSPIARTGIFGSRTTFGRATLLGYCLGGIFATVYAATHPGEWIRDQVWALTAMTMPARNLRIWRELVLHFWDPRYLERQRLVSRWLNGLVPFPGEAYRQFVKELVQANKLVRRELVVDGNVADPA